MRVKDIDKEIEKEEAKNGLDGWNPNYLNLLIDYKEVLRLYKNSLSREATLEELVRQILIEANPTKEPWKCEKFKKLAEFVGYDKEE